MQRLCEARRALRSAAAARTFSLMQMLDFSEAEADLEKVMDRVVDEHDPIIVTRPTGRHVVMISLADYQGWDETAYLLSSPENARRLRESIAQLEAGMGVERELIEPDADPA